MEKYQVLLVDNEEYRVNYFKTLLSPDFIITFAPDAATAIAILKNNQNINLVILNYLLKKEDGKEVLRKIIDTKLVVNTIVYLGLKSHDLVVEAMKNGAYFCFTEPISAMELQHKALNALNKTTIEQKIRIIFEQSSHEKLSYESSMAMLKRLCALRLLKGDSLRNKEMAFLVPLDKITDPELAEFKANMIKQREAEAKSPSDKPAVLIVDDEEEMRVNLNDILGTYYETIRTGSAKEALAAIEPLENIDVMILDIHLPDKNGDILMPELKALHPESEIIIITGFRETEKAVNLLHKGAYTYINKPFKAALIRKTVEEAVQIKYLKQFLLELGEGPNADKKSPYAELIEQVNAFTDYYSKQAAAEQPVSYADIFRLIPSIMSRSFVGIPPETTTLPTTIKKDDMLFWLAYRFGPKY